MRAIYFLLLAVVAAADDTKPVIQSINPVAVPPGSVRSVEITGTALDKLTSLKVEARFTGITFTLPDGGCKKDVATCPIRVIVEPLALTGTYKLYTNDDKAAQAPSFSVLP